MKPISKVQCGALLSVWLERHSSPDVVKQIVRDTGYNDSPFFGAEKKKIKIFGEVLIVNCAMAIFAVNQVLKFEAAKEVIDAFLLAAKTPIFGFIERKDPGFQKRYPGRMADYFKVMSGSKPALGLSYSFFENIDQNPLDNLEGQFLLAARFSAFLNSTIDMLQTFSFID